MNAICRVGDRRFVYYINKISPFFKFRKKHLSIDLFWNNTQSSTFLFLVHIYSRCDFCNSINVCGNCFLFLFSGVFVVFFFLPLGVCCAVHYNPQCNTACVCHCVFTVCLRTARKNVFRHVKNKLNVVESVTESTDMRSMEKTTCTPYLLHKQQ